MPPAFAADQSDTVKTLTQNPDTAHARTDFNLLTYDRSQAFQGLTAFVLWERDNINLNWVRSIVVVMDMEGNFVNTLVNNDGFNRIYETQMFNSTTVMYLTASDHIPYLWNFRTDTVKALNFPSGFHDFEYNPFTDTFLVKRFAIQGQYDGLEIQYHDLYEYDRSGNVLWYWNSSKYFPFNPDLWTGETFEGQIEYMHANSIFWEVETGKIFYNSKNFDTFYQIDKSTGKVDWGLGRLGNFTLLDETGKVVDSLWYHAHSVEKIAPDRFILYDNDDMNLTRSDPTADGISKMVEIKINLDNMTAQRVWSYSSPADHYSPVWGDANRLPNGNSLATFAYFTHDSYLTEVNPAGDVVWEVAFNRTDTRSWSIFRLERFIEKPLVEPSSRYTRDGIPIMDLSVWNTYRTRFHADARIIIKQDGQVLLNEAFRFNPNWETTRLIYELPTLHRGQVEITVINQNSIKKTIDYQFGEVNSSEQATNPYYIGLLPIIGIPILLRRKRRNQ